MKKAMAVVLISASVIVPSLMATAQETELDKKLRFSVLLNKSDEVKSLIKAGADVNKRFDLGASRNITPLYLAVLLGNADVAKTLIDSGADARAEWEGGTNLLHVAALYGGNKAVTELLIANGLDVNARATTSGEQVLTPLLIAASKGNKEVAETLIKNKADVSAKLSTNGYTPLHLAARDGRKEVTELLIASGADVNAVSRYGETPLDLAKSKGHEELADLLSKHGGIPGKKELR